MSKIEWTDETWNVTTGCTRVSAGCDNCYAVAMTKRLAGIEATKEKYSGLVNEGKNHFNGKIKLHHEELMKPLRWQKPRRVFVNSMSDLFHPDVPYDFIAWVFTVMALSPAHTFQVLTKRPERMAEITSSLAFKSRVSANVAVHVLRYGMPDIRDEKERLPWPLPNVWLGTSVENQDAADERIPWLLQSPAVVRFLSCEPLLGEVNFRWTNYAEKATGEKFRDYLERRGNYNQYEGLKGIHQVIVGGESGPNARPMHPDWVRLLRDQCTEAGVAFFFKQWGAWQDGSDKESKEDRIILTTGKQYDVGEINCNSRPDERLDEWNAAKPTRISRVGKKKAGRLLDGREWNQMPVPEPPTVESREAVRLSGTQGADPDSTTPESRSAVRLSDTQGADPESGTKTTSTQPKNQ